ncbi:MAG: translocation/assembly module TamB [Lentimicrobium sp.]|nr:translocation/assembly module TamB [Lentimicrobium sp.]
MKVILWVAFSFVVLFILIALLIQLPVIQNKITGFAIDFVSSRTLTKIELDKISISFPKKVVINGLYLEDLNKDTLLYAGEVKINIRLFALIKNKVDISSFALDDAVLNLSRAEADSLFNFNFLLTAFSDTSAKKTVEPEKTSKWIITIDKVGLKNNRFLFDDLYGGTYAALNVKQLKLTMDRIDLANLIFKIDEVSVDKMTAGVLISKASTSSDESSSGKLPEISANKIHISNSYVTYGDSVVSRSAVADVDRLALKNSAIDLNRQTESSEKISLSKSNVRYKSVETAPSNENGQLLTNTPEGNNDWKVSAGIIELEDNTLAYHVVNMPVLKNTFDANHMTYRDLSLKATGFYWSLAKSEVSVKEFSTVDQHNFLISQFEADLSMDLHSITAKNAKLKTAHSTADADLNIRFSSLGELVDSLPSMILNLDIRNVQVRNSEIVYFSPELHRQPFFKNATNITTVSGKVNGPINNLSGKNLTIKTGSNTSLTTDFTIRGLPDAETAWFNFPNLIINSGRDDIKMLAGTAIPDSISLPETIGLRVNFKGEMKSFVTNLAMNSSYGSADVSASVDKSENFKSNISLVNFDVGRLMMDTAMFGRVSLKAETNGQGLDKNTIRAEIKADVSQIWLNSYDYHNLIIDGDITGQKFEGKVNLDDEYAAFDFDGLVNLNPKEEQYKFKLNVKGANLQKLKITDKDIRISMRAESDLKGKTADEINGTAGITKIYIAHEDKEYLLESFMLASINESKKSELTVDNALVGIKYKGTFSPAFLVSEIRKFINNYFPFSESDPLATEHEPQNFEFEVQLHNHPILADLFVPELKEFEPGLIKGSFDSEKGDLKLNAEIKKIVYGNTEVRNLLLDVGSDLNAITYKITSTRISGPQFNLDNFLVSGQMADSTLVATMSSIDDKQNKKLLINAQIIKENANYKLTLDPEDFYLMNERWGIAADNYVAFGETGFLIHNLFLDKAGSEVRVYSVNDKFNDDLSIVINNFDLNDLSGVVSKDTSLIKGTVDGKAMLIKVKDAYGLVADLQISDLVVREIPVGNFTMNADNPTSQKFDIEMKLSGHGNDVTASGYFIPKGGENSVSIKAGITSLSLKNFEAFSMGTITEASGNLSGNVFVEGNTGSPEITGQLTFNDAFIKPSALNNMLQLKNETVELKSDGVYFNSFTLLDPGEHKATIDGTVKMKNFQDFIFALDVKTEDFLLFNTTSKDNEVFYGRMIIDSRISVKGPMSLPVINARVKMKDGSNFTFAVPEDKLTTYKGEDVVVIDNKHKINPILYREEKPEVQKSSFTGFDLSSIIEVDKEATLRLMMDPSSSDSLVVRGEAALNLTIDRSGKMSLTGAYNLNDGSYIVTLESVVKRRFDIDPGSTLIWNGDPLDADISINAIYTVRASPIDLVSDQIAGLSEADQNTYKQRYPFLVYLKLRGAIMKPEISFDIQLRPEDKGIFGGAVNARLTMLNEDPSALNKQVFALLVLGRFIQENPLQSEANLGASTVVRSTVGKFLSAELNKLSAKAVPGVELNFDIQSYDDYETGQAEGRTQVDIGAKKQLFNERLSVQVGGVVDVEGERARQNSASNIGTDVTIEYKLTKDGRYRLKGFSHNQYEGAIEGQLVETGVGVMYVRNFNRWKQFFRVPGKRRDSTITKTP